MQFSLVLTLALVMGIFLPATAFASDIGVTINGTAVDFGDQAPAIIDGRTLVPVRAVFEAVGFEVDFDDQTRTVTLDSDEFAIRIAIDSATFTVNDQEFALEVSAQIIGGRTLLPIRAVLEAVGYFVEWDAATQTVLVASEPFATRPEQLQEALVWLAWFDTTYAEFAAMGNFAGQGAGTGMNAYSHPTKDDASLGFSWDDPSGTPVAIFLSTRLWLGVDEILVRDALEMFGDEAYVIFYAIFGTYEALIYRDGFVFNFTVDEGDAPVSSVRIQRGERLW